MAEVSMDLMFEVLKQVRDRQADMDLKLDELKGEMQAFRGHMVALQQDVHNIYTILGRHEARLDRIDRRLELVEPASN